MSAANKSGGSSKCCRCSNCFKTNGQGTKLTRQNKPTGGTWCCQRCGKPVNHKIQTCRIHGRIFWECDPYGCPNCYLGTPSLPRSIKTSRWRKIENPTSEEIQAALSHTYPGLF